MFNSLSPFNEAGLLNVIVDTPRGSRNKYQFDPVLELFKLGGMLTIGHSFPFNFGFVPQTTGGDGDPLDVLILMEEPAFVGCLVECRLVGGLEAYQTEANKNTERNDRLFAVSESSVEFKNIENLKDLPTLLVEQIEHFFCSYNKSKGKDFEIRSRYGANTALRIVKKASNRRT